jgi:hypothetical protein
VLDGHVAFLDAHVVLHLQQMPDEESTQQKEDDHGNTKVGGRADRQGVKVAHLNTA